MNFFLNSDIIAFLRYLDKKIFYYLLFNMLDKILIGLPYVKI
jgi:hypothetical protein